MWHKTDRASQNPPSTPDSSDYDCDDVALWLHGTALLVRWPCGADSAAAGSAPLCGTFLALSATVTASRNSQPGAAHSVFAAWGKLAACDRMLADWYLCTPVSQRASGSATAAGEG